MSIYKSDVPEYVRIALDSILNQTLLPNEIVIVGDGPVPAPLEQVIRDVQSSISSSNLQQMLCFEEDPDLSIVGGMITEFVDSPDNVVDKRVLPLDDEGIKRFMRSRCGVNHVTVIFKKADNIPDVVVNVRSGYDQFARRSGWSYYLDHCAIFRFMYREGLISFPRLVYNYVVRGVVQFLMPNSLRTWTYQHLLRKE